VYTKGLLRPGKERKLGWWRDQFVKGARKINFPVHKPIADLTGNNTKLYGRELAMYMALMAFLKKLNKIFIRFNTGYC
jgi:excinuclease ABC subunit A